MADKRALTLTDKKKLEEELAQLQEEKKQVAEDIKIARGFGDLSENAEYDAAKEREAHVYGRITELEETLAHATFVDDSQVSTDSVSVGNVVTVSYEDDDEDEEFTLVGFTEADPMKNFISQDSPMGAALIGTTVGQTVVVRTPGGDVKLTIKSIAKR